MIVHSMPLRLLNTRLLHDVISWPFQGLAGPPDSPRCLINQPISKRRKAIPTDTSRHPIYPAKLHISYYRNRKTTPGLVSTSFRFIKPRCSKLKCLQIRAEQNQRSAKERKFVYEEWRRSIANVQQRCIRCRGMKVKCSGSEPCSRCSRKKQPCRFPAEDTRISVSGLSGLEC